MLFSQERVRAKINQSKLALAVSGCNAIFEGNNKTKNPLVKNGVHGSQGTMLFSQE